MSAAFRAHALIRIIDRGQATKVVGRRRFPRPFLAKRCPEPARSAHVLSWQGAANARPPCRFFSRHGLGFARHRMISVFRYGGRTVGARRKVGSHTGDLDTGPMQQTCTYLTQGARIAKAHGRQAMGPPWGDGTFLASPARRFSRKTYRGTQHARGNLLTAGVRSSPSTPVSPTPMPGIGTGRESVSAQLANLSPHTFAGQVMQIGCRTLTLMPSRPMRPGPTIVSEAAAKALAPAWRRRAQ